MRKLSLLAVPLVTVPTNVTVLPLVVLVLQDCLEKGLAL